MKKIFSFLLLVVIILGLAGCGKGKSNINSVISGELLTSDLSINDFDWSVDESKCYGSDCYTFKLKNNSKYDIIGVDIKYFVKDSATDDELKVFDSFMKKHDGYIDEDDSPRDVTLAGSGDHLIEPGETIDDINLTVGFKRWAWYDYPTSKQYSLMEPGELQLGIIYKNTLYVAYYNFNAKTWKFDTKKATVDVWTKSDLGKLVDKPEGKHFIVVNDDEDMFKIYVYGVTKSMYNEYVSNVKAKGFVDDDSYSTIFDGKKSDGYGIYLSYDNSSESMVLRIQKPDED